MKIKMKMLTSFITLSLISQAHAYDLTKKFGLGANFGFPIPVWGNQFNNNADPEWAASLYGRYHFDPSIAMELGVSKDAFRHSPLKFENINLLGLWRIAAASDLTPVLGLGVGATRIKNYTPNNIKLSLLGRAGVEYGINPNASFGLNVDYRYVSKIMGDMPSNPAHVISPQVAFTWYFGGDNKGMAPAKEEPMVKDVVSTEKSSTQREMHKADITVEFAFAKAEIKPEYLAGLKKIASQLKSSNEMQGYIEGHADSTGPEQFNDVLSLQRAEAVKAKLIEYGADKDRLKAEGFGESRPVATNDTVAGRQKNRRSAVYISVRTHLGVM